MKSDRKSILSYITTIDVDKTVAEISKLLAAARATAILSEFNDGLGIAISFRIKTEFGPLTFRLPANFDGVYAVLQRSHTIGPKFKTRSHAARVAWRVILHWLDAQLAMIQAGVATAEQIFLPYVQDQADLTIYEQLMGMPIFRLFAAASWLTN
jgi:hypothetical protein